MGGASRGRGGLFGERGRVGGGEHVGWGRGRERTGCWVMSGEQYKVLIEDPPPIMRLFLARVVRKLQRTTDLAFGK